jgi:hypothetical protein
MIAEPTVETNQLAGNRLHDSSWEHAQRQLRFEMPRPII